MAHGYDPALQVVAGAIGQFSNNFLKAVANDNPDHNLITSSLSAHIVLAMAAYGANGITAEQMRSALHIPSDDEVWLSGYRSLIHNLNDPKGVQLLLANKIYTSINVVVKPAYQGFIAAKFASAVMEVDFSDAQGTANTINSWCEEKTNRRIKDVITPDSLAPDTACVLVNALYFKGQWENKFNPLLTRNTPFHVDDTITINVPTMYVRKRLRFGVIPGMDAKFVEIPYQYRMFSMVIIVPNKMNGLKTVPRDMHRVLMNRNLRRVYPRVVELFLPKFNVESSLDLRTPLENLGMADMFKPQANFSGIADDPLNVSRMIQKAFIEVNEEGSGAASASCICTRVCSTRYTPTVFRVNRPFYYAIHHSATKTPLFAGVVYRPNVA